MFVQMLRRPDTRRDIIGVGVSLFVLALLWFSARTPTASKAGPMAPVLRSVTVGEYHLNVLRVECSPDNQITTVILSVAGPQSTECPLEGPHVEGLEADGGEWTGIATSLATINFAGAAGESIQETVSPGSGLMVLRFRGSAPAGTLQLHFQLQAQPVVVDLPSSIRTVV